jgi:RNA polymerase sigma factor (sigma-70 family)
MVTESLKETIFQRILDENSSRLHIFAQKNTRGDNWQDLEQEILLRIWKGLDCYEGRANTGALVHSEAYFALKGFQQKLNRPEKAVKSLELLPEFRQYTYSTEGRMDAIHMVEAFIQSLGDDDRTMFLMYLNGCTYREISESTGSEEGALRVRIHRLKKQLEMYAEC